MSDEDGWILDGIDRDYSTPFSLNEDNLLSIQEVRVGLAAGEGMQPTVLIQFQVVDKDGDAVVLPPFATLVGDPQLEALCRQILGFPQLHMNRPVEIHECPGCGRELHGDMKFRGGCLDCYPEVTPEDEEAILNEGGET